MLKGALGETKAGMQILQMKYQEEFNNLGIIYKLLIKLNSYIIPLACAFKCILSLIAS